MTQNKFETSSKHFTCTIALIVLIKMIIQETAHRNVILNAFDTLKQKYESSYAWRPGKKERRRTVRVKLCVYCNAEHESTRNCFNNRELVTENDLELPVIELFTTSVTKHFLLFT